MPLEKEGFPISFLHGNSFATGTAWKEIAKALQKHKSKRALYARTHTVNKQK
jgi:hypothetical protein